MITMTMTLQSDLIQSGSVRSISYNDPCVSEERAAETEMTKYKPN